MGALAFGIISGIFQGSLGSLIPGSIPMDNNIAAFATIIGGTIDYVKSKIFGDLTTALKIVEPGANLAKNLIASLKADGYPRESYKNSAGDYRGMHTHLKNDHDLQLAEKELDIDKNRIEANKAFNDQVRAAKQRNKLFFFLNMVYHMISGILGLILIYLIQNNLI